MLRGAVEGQIKNWKFQIPLPVNAQSDFEAIYKFSLHAADESLDDDLDAPPFSSGSGDIVTIPSSALQISGQVRSLDGTQMIDVTPAPPEQAKDLCPEDKEQQLPTGSAADDYIELFRSCEKGCLDYRVRVYRDGLVEWHGRGEVAVEAEASSRIRPEVATATIAKFQSQQFWLACSAPLPPFEQDRDAEEFDSGNYLTARISGHIKSVNVDGWFLDDAGVRLMWAVDRAADTHRWRHGDSANEPFANMYADLSMPKPGITALMRATYRFSPSNAQLTLEPLKRLIDAGVDIEAADESGWTALMYAAELNPDDKAVQLLLEAHASVNRASLHGDTALMMAAYVGRLSEGLLKARADINARNADGVTMLMLLAQHVDPEELDAALNAGADSTVKDSRGRTAVDYLTAAAHQKAIVPLPRPGMVIVLPPALESETFRKSEALLRAAMKKKMSLPLGF